MKKHENQNRFPLSSLMSSRTTKRAMAFLLASGLFLASPMGAVLAQGLDTGIQKAVPVKGQITIGKDVNIAPAGQKVTLNLRDADIRDVLNSLAQQGNFNLILDDSVSGTLTVDIKDITINKALEYIFTLSELSYTKDGNVMIVTTNADAESKNLQVHTLKTIPILYKEASAIAGTLNSTVFSVNRPGGSSKAVVGSDNDSNSLLVMGTDADIKLVADALRELDVPRNRKVYRIRHNTPSYVANVLAANFFTSLGGGAAGGSGGESSSGGGAAASGGGGGSSSGGGGSSSGAASLATFTAGGVTFISEPIAGTLTVMGTDEQVALIDSLIKDVDVKRPQVAIEVSLVEVQDTALKTMVPTLPQMNLGKEVDLQLFSGGTAANIFRFNHNTNIGDLSNNVVSKLLPSFSLTFLNQDLRGKILANPTVVTMDNTAVSINITDQVPTISQTNTIVNGVQTISTTITTQSAGVTMSLTPQVFGDGSVVLNLTPNVTQPIRTVEAQTDNGGTITTSSTVLLATRSMTLAGVRVKDGQTLVIGGLVREASQLDLRKVPGLEKLPIVSAMFRSTNTNSKDKTELVMMVTPHILKEDAVSYFDEPYQGKPNNPNQGGVQPVSLPKFIGQVPAALQPAVNQAPHEKAAAPAAVKPAEAAPAQKTAAPAAAPIQEDVIPLKPRAMEVSAPAFKLPSFKRKAKKEASGSLSKEDAPQLMDELLKD